MISIAIYAGLATALWAGSANAHLTAFAKGMYCFDGNTTTPNPNSEDPIFPLYKLPLEQWWFHHENNCDMKPPAEGDVLELPAGGSFTVEVAANQAFTSLSFGGQFAGKGVIGKQQEYPDNLNVPTCIIQPNIHTQNKSMVAGTAFSIAYVSDIKQATPENMVIFSVNSTSPWERVTTYQVPADMPACPNGKCICAWQWIPNGCGEPNSYHMVYDCNVTGAKSTIPVGTPKPPVWCEGEPEKCVKGPKQGLYWNQATGNNIEVEGTDLSGQPKSPAYNTKCGFSDGAQNDIFEGSSDVSSPVPPSQPIPPNQPIAPSSPVPPSSAVPPSQPAPPSQPTPPAQPASPSLSAPPVPPVPSPSPVPSHLGIPPSPVASHPGSPVPSHPGSLPSPVSLSSSSPNGPKKRHRMTHHWNRRHSTRSFRSLQ